MRVLVPYITRRPIDFQAFRIILPVYEHVALLQISAQQHLAYSILKTAKQKTLQKFYDQSPTHPVPHNATGTLYQ